MGIFTYSKPKLTSLKRNNKLKRDCKTKYCKKKYTTDKGNKCPTRFCSGGFCPSYCTRNFG